MNYKIAAFLSVSLAALLMLPGCQPADQQTPGEDPMDTPLADPPRGSGESQQPQSQAPATTQQLAQAQDADQAPQQGGAANDEGRRLFEQHCSVCHTLDLPRSQRLNLSTWREVVEDMEKFGMTWVSEEEQQLIVEHLAENYGRDTAR